MYILPAAHYTSAQFIQVCETCNRLIFMPHAIVQPYLREIAAA